MFGIVRFLPDVVGAFVPAVSASLVKAVLSYSSAEQSDSGLENSLMVC